MLTFLWWEKHYPGPKSVLAESHHVITSNIWPQNDSLLWYNVYYCKKWTWWPEFKSWMKLFVFQIVLILLGKVCIQLFSLQLLVNSRADWLFNFGMTTGLGERKLIQTCNMNVVEGHFWIPIPEKLMHGYICGWIVSHPQFSLANP